MKRLFSLSVTILILALVASACAPAAPQATPTPAGITLQDGLGREVQLAGPAQKIISLAPSNSEILFALGASAQMIARDETSDYPEAVKALPTIGGFNGFNLEQITKLQPDLVLAAEINTPEQVKAIENLGLKVYYLANPKTLDDLYVNLKIVGQLSGREKEAAALVQQLSQRAAAVQKAMQSAGARPKVYYEMDATDPAKPWTSGPGSFVAVLIDLAGGENVGAKLTSAWAQISQEDLILQNPDLILLGDSNYGMTAEKLAARPGWNGIKAVTEKKVLPFDDNLVSRPGPRLVDGLEQFAKLIHPEKFQ